MDYLSLFKSLLGGGQGTQSAQQPNAAPTPTPAPSPGVGSLYQALSPQAQAMEASPSAIEYQNALMKAFKQTPEQNK